MRLEIVRITDLRIICYAGSYRKEYQLSQKLEECKAQLQAALAAEKSKKTPSGNTYLK